MGSVSQAIGGRPDWARLEGAYSNPTSQSYQSVQNQVYRVNSNPVSASSPKVLSPSGGVVYDSLGNVYKSPATLAAEATASANPPAQPTPQPVSQPATATPSYGTLTNLARASIPTVLGAVLEKPVGDAGEFVGRNVIVPYVTKLDEALGINKVEQNLGLLPNPLAKAVAKDAEARYQKALQNAQSANPANTKGSNAGLSNSDQYTSGVSYNVTVRIVNNDPVAVANGTNVPTYGTFTGLAPFYISGSGTNNTSLVFADHTYELYELQPLTETTISSAVRSDGLPNTTDTSFAAPKDSPKPKTDPSQSPDFFPWLPVVQVQNDPILDYANAYSASPAYDNKPFKEPTPAIFSPELASPVASANPSPATPVSSPTAAASSPSTTSNPTASPVSTSPTSTASSPSQNKNPLTSPLNPPATTPSQTTPNTASFPDLGTIATTVGALGLAISAIASRVTNIESNTSPVAQQTNAKQGVCDAMQPNQCGYEGVKQATTEATQPIANTANANNGLLGQILSAIAALANLVATIWQFLQDKIGAVLKILDNQWVANLLNAVNTAVSVHNALMLSQNVATTLGTIIDQTISFFGFQFKDASGASHTASDVIGHNTQAFLTTIIGADRITQLETDWKIANRIYQTGMNIGSTVQTMVDPVAMQLQNTGVNVANIGNALRDNRVVSPKSYPHMADDPASMRAMSTDRFAQFTSTIQNVDNSVQHLATITGTVQSTAQSVTMLQTEFKTLSDAANVNSATDTQIKNQIKAQVARQATPTEVALVSKSQDIKP